MDVHWQYNTSLLEVIFESQKVGNNQELEELAVIIDIIGVVEIILEIGEKVSPGHLVKAMIINGLGFV